MTKIAYAPFMEFCKTHIGRELPTIGGKAKFKLYKVENDCLRWIVLSTNDDRHYSKKNWILKFIEYFNKTNSLSPSEYNKNIHCTTASYILTLIKLYID